MMEKFTKKTPEELDKQLGGVESFLNSKIKPENLRAEMLSLSLDELKSRYPKIYNTYFAILQTEAKISHFPDMPKGEDSEKPKINPLPTGARQNAFKVDLGDEIRVVKPLESLGEKDVARVASELGIGPKQFKTEEGFLHEEFIKGTPLLKLEEEKCTPEFMENLGQKFGQALKKLHEKNILVNDQILTDDFGKSHMIIDEKGEARFIDFGASIDMSNFPDISDEAVLSLMRTDPFMSFRIRNVLSASPEDQKNEIAGYREHILSQYKTKQDLIRATDDQRLNEGLYFLQSRLPNVQYFIEGLKKEYK